MKTMKNFPVVGGLSNPADAANPRKSVANAMMASQGGFLGIPQPFQSAGLARPFTQPQPASSPVPAYASQSIPEAEQPATMQAEATPTPTAAGNTQPNLISMLENLSTQLKQPAPRPAPRFQQQMQQAIGLDNVVARSPAPRPVPGFQQQLLNQTGLGNVHAAPAPPNPNVFMQKLFSLGRR